MIRALLPVAAGIQPSLTGAGGQRKMDLQCPLPICRRRSDRSVRLPLCRAYPFNHSLNDGMSKVGKSRIFLERQ